MALGICFLAFEWKTEIKEPPNLGGNIVLDIDTEIIPITRQEQVQVSAPPPMPVLADVINIVSDDVEIDTELVIEDSEADESTVIEITPIILDAGIRSEDEVEEETKVFYIVEEMPEFPGGELALRKYLSNAIKYPVIAQENGIQGKVYINFVVGKDGMVTEATILRSVDPHLDKEALRVVNSLPKWKPGKQGGKYVRVSFSVPISFILEGL